ncbi:MAG: hypothetical protein CMJ64_19995 [Planctomycetaceae bacterium]|jgi:hypothetical protein|nr:hypothetical protein [Planctomycetaceae bacterium]
MDLVLRPSESIEFRWDHIGKQYTPAEQALQNKTLMDLGTYCRVGDGTHTTTSATGSCDTGPTYRKPKPGKRSKLRAACAPSPSKAS